MKTINDKIIETVSKYFEDAFGIVCDEVEIHYEDGTVDNNSIFLAQVEIAKMLQIERGTYQ